MKISDVRSLISRRRYEEALAACEALLRNSSESKEDILRARAYVYAMSGERENAVRDYQTLIDEGKANIRDLYLAASDALYTRDLQKAQEWLTEVLRLGKEQDERWFLAATLFYLSYVHMELGDYTRAVECLDKATLEEADISMPLPHIGMCSNQELREEIRRRHS